VRAQAQNVFSRLAFWVGFFVGAGLFAWATYGFLPDANALVWFVGSIVAGLLAGWAFGTVVMLWLAGS
jgi:LytS/YehU family sensor histidine kinase